MNRPFVYQCIDKKYNNRVITHYLLKDMNDPMGMASIWYDKDSVKDGLRSGRIVIDNLQLTSDNRIIDKHIKKSVLGDKWQEKIDFLFSVAAKSLGYSFPNCKFGYSKRNFDYTKGIIAAETFNVYFGSSSWEIALFVNNNQEFMFRDSLNLFPKGAFTFEGYIGRYLNDYVKNYLMSKGYKSAY